MLVDIISNASDIIVLVILFGASIFVHELGHFLAAIKLGLVVDVFSIGFGPAIWKKKIKGVVFKISWIPLGGYVALPQLDPTGMSTVQGSNDGDEPTQRELPSVSGWRKIIVSVAGAVGNVLFAIVLALIIYWSPNAVTYKGAPVVGAVDQDSAAFAQGLRAGDEILAANGKGLSSWYEFSMEALLAGNGTTVELLVGREGETQTIEVPLTKKEGEAVPRMEGVTRQSIPCLLSAVLPEGSAAAAGLKSGDIVKSFDGIDVVSTDEFIALVGSRPGVSVPIVIEREGKALEFAVVPKMNEELGRALIGVRPVNMVMPWMQEKLPGAQLRSDAMGIVRLLKALVTPRESKQAARGLGGPVAIVAALWIAIKISLFNAVGFLRFLNVNLAILNLLPIPILDGGHVIFALWEMVTRRKPNATFVNVLVNGFGVLLIGVFLLLTFRDVDRLFPGVKRFFQRENPAEVGTEPVEVPEDSK